MTRKREATDQEWNRLKDNHILSNTTERKLLLDLLARVEDLEEDGGYKVSSPKRG